MRQIEYIFIIGLLALLGMHAVAANDPPHKWTPFDCAVALSFSGPPRHFEFHSSASGRQYKSKYFAVEQVTQLSPEYVNNSQVKTDLPEAMKRVDLAIDSGRITRADAEKNWLPRFRAAQNALEFMRALGSFGRDVLPAQNLTAASIHSDILEDEHTTRAETISRDERPDRNTTVDIAKLEEQRRQHSEQVKSLENNDLSKILYFRRFPEEYPLDTVSRKELGLSRALPNFKFYDAPPISRKQPVEPYKTQFDIPPDAKIGFVIGYHHLEKPWGYILRDMMLSQVAFPKDQVVFIEIQNGDMPTGLDSPRSNAEIQHAIRQHGITHIIDLHEQLAGAIDNIFDSHFAPKFHADSRKAGSALAHTADPFVPLWMIEQYYKGDIPPGLQEGVNGQIKRLEQLISGIH